jgi:hypothetical protein
MRNTLVHVIHDFGSRGVVLDAACCSVKVLAECAYSSRTDRYTHARKPKPLSIL